MVLKPRLVSEWPTSTVHGRKRAVHRSGKILRPLKRGRTTRGRSAFLAVDDLYPRAPIRHRATLKDNSPDARRRVRQIKLRGERLASNVDACSWIVFLLAVVLPWMVRHSR